MERFWLAYLIALPFHRVWTLPGLGTKLQPPEIVLIALVLAAGWRWLGRHQAWQPVSTDWGAAAWGLACAASLPVLLDRPPTSGAAAVTEAVGGISLVALYAAIRVTAEPQNLVRFGSWFGRSAAVAGAVGVAGVVLTSFGITTPLSTSADTLVPVLGQAPRAQAFTAGPQMLASILLMAVPLFIGARLDQGWRRRDSWWTALLGLGLVATLSKTALCVIPALAVMWAIGPARAPRSPGASRTRLRSALVVWLMTAAVFTAASHLMLVREAEVGLWRTGQVVAGAPVAAFEWRGARWVVMPTTYVFNKWVSLRAIAERWPAGLGAGQQPSFASTLQARGQMPVTMWITYPHCTYLGPAAELGVLGLVALLVLLVTGGACLRRLTGPDGPPGWLPAALAGAAAGFLIEAISTDLMNCRHYWWLLAVIAAETSRLRSGRSVAPMPGDSHS